MSVSVIGRKVGNAVMVHGTWTHTVGAAEETLAVAGRVLAAIFTHVDSSGAHDVLMSYSLSQSTTTGVTTITIHGQAAVTTGRFVVITT